MKTKLFAPCKINLSLNVMNKNEDDMHYLSSIMHTIDLCDEITVEIFKSNDKKINLKSNLYFIPTDNKNIVYKCIELFFDTFNIKDNINVYLKKNVPVSAGLGGGSSDATEMLLFLNRFYHKNLNEKELIDIAIKLGSDCPFFIKKGTCLVEGIGEKITPLKNAFDKNKLNFKTFTPNIKLSTKKIYELYDKNIKNINVEEKNKINEEKTKNIIKALSIGDKTLLLNNVFNDLEPVAISVNKEILDLKNKLIKENGFAMMSGSGPTVFTDI